MGSHLYYDFVGFYLVSLMEKSYLISVRCGIRLGFCFWLLTDEDTTTDRDTQSEIELANAFWANERADVGPRRAKKQSNEIQV